MTPRMWPCNSTTLPVGTPPLAWRLSMFCVTTPPSLPSRSSRPKKQCAGFGMAASASLISERFMSHQASLTPASVLKFRLVILAASKVPQMVPAFSRDVQQDSLDDSHEGSQLSQAPGGFLRKGVMPDSTEIPAPVRATTFAACRTRSATSAAVVTCRAGAEHWPQAVPSSWISSSLRRKLQRRVTQASSSGDSVLRPAGSRTVSTQHSSLRCSMSSMRRSRASNSGRLASP
mmetsp:Transcript_51940/g.166292  ORF Transcript_51940/g.166292 Transcript_51940/m.166292 type:complete len:232 (-) Transcript_51940:346-1041(-)